MFKVGDVVSHIHDIDVFYIITSDLKNGQYEARKYGDTTDQCIKYIFIGNYLLSKSDRRDHRIDSILNFPVGYRYKK